LRNQEKRLERALQLLDSDLKVSVKNKKHIHKFINYLQAEGRAKTLRQIKYVVLLKRLARMLNKDFNLADKDDIIQLVSGIEKAHSLRKKHTEKPLSEWSKHDFRVTIKRFYKWLREDEGLEFGVGEYPSEVKWISASMKREKRVLPRQILDDEDLRLLLERTTNTRDRAFIYLLYETGCRIGEIVSLRIKDIIASDQYGKKITVNGKTGERTVRICDSAPSLDIWLREHPMRDDDEAPLFCGLNYDKRGEPVSDNFFRKLLRKIGKEAKISKPLYPHHFRHSAASRYAHSLTESQLNEYFGWVQGSGQSGTYVHSIGKKMDDAVLAMHGKKRIEQEAIYKQPKVCPRCKTANDYFANVCQVCNLGLDKASIMQFDKEKEFFTEHMIKQFQAMQLKIDNLEYQFALEHDQIDFEEKDAEAYKKKLPTAKERKADWKQTQDKMKKVDWSVGIKKSKKAH
jgi:integrase/recombinase XerD